MLTRRKFLKLCGTTAVSWALTDALYVELVKAATNPLEFRADVHYGERVMVFAPHCDDETLGPGGLIQLAVKAGAVVRVVLTTNGDGFTMAAEEAFRSFRVTPEEYIQLAYIRQKETLTALKRLGVPESAVTFLGFPDRGTASEWEDHWPKSDPYVSHYTRVSHSPYRNSYVRNAPHAGAQLAEEIGQLLRDFSPDTVVLPHPNDAHPDHWATHNFVRYVLAMRQAVGSPRGSAVSLEPRLLYYLVHRGNWPQPQGYDPQAKLVPPSKLMGADTRWETWPLTKRETEEKYLAILDYRSQVAVMRRFLVSFARSNDLFGCLPPTPVVDSAADSEWTTAVFNPLSDTLGREAEGAANLREIALRADRDYLYCQLILRLPPSPFVVYRLHLHALPATLEGTPLRSDLWLRMWQGQWTAFSGAGKPRKPDLTRPVTVDGRTLTVRLPRGAAGPHRRFFVAAESFFGIPIDRTAWRFVELQSLRD